MFKQNSSKKGKVQCHCCKRPHILILVLCLFLCFSCTEAMKQYLFEERQLVVAGGPTKPWSEKNARLEEAVEKLHMGRYIEARKILSELIKDSDDSGGMPSAVFYLGIVKLLTMDDLAQMKACKKYFSSYKKKYPNGPYQKNTENIVNVLNQYIVLAQKDKLRMKELEGQVEKQNKEIETLKYQIQKLEEIQQETERERQLLELN